MATLVLTTVGTLVGGPIGGAIGALIGGTLDQKLFGASARGPRLSDLSVQTSAYGNAIPKIFGTLRIAGTVIWATDLDEHKKKSGGGKGKPKTTTYSYSASFAVALSGRPLRAVHRIWADGNLLRGSGGDWKTDVGSFRLYNGDDAQAIDPLIASAEGASATPAHRGIAYAVFEDLQLADFGHRIPSLTFEVEADDGAISVGNIAQALAPEALAGGDGTLLGGYAVAESNVREALAAIGDVVPLSLVDDGDMLRLVRPLGAAVALTADALGAGAAKPSVRRSVDRQATGTLPDEVTLTYFDPSRDYQSGTQRARGGGVARRRSEVVLAAGLDAGAAKGLAEARLATAWAARATATATLPWRWLGLKPGDMVMLPDDPQLWHVASASLEAMTVKLELTGSPDGVAVAAIASAGRSTHQSDATSGTTILHILDLPALEETLPTVPRQWIAACGTAPGWRRAGLSASLDGGTSWADIGSTAAPAVIGTTLGALGDGDPSFRDRVASVDIELAHDGMALLGRDDTVFDAAANLAMIGDELVQFASAEQIAPHRWRLRNLLRGRRGTEWATAGHDVGERFVLLEADTLLAYDPPASAIGATLSILATGLGDTVPVIQTGAIVGRALRPPGPVRLTVERLADGALQFGWRRRSRAGWHWLDGVDVPLGEDGERYRLTLTPSVGLERTVELDSAGYLYASAEQAADGSAGAAAIDVALSQVGALAASLPAATRHFTL